MKISEQLYRGSLTTIIMSMLNDGSSMYGYEISEKVKQLTDGNLKLTEGALYPALHKLEAEGMLEVSVKEVNNRPRKYYKLTRQGKKETANKLQELNNFLQQMSALLNLKTAW